MVHLFEKPQNVKIWVLKNVGRWFIVGVHIKDGVVFRYENIEKGHLLIIICFHGETDIRIR